MSPEELLQKIGARQLSPPVKSKAERAQSDWGNGKARGDELNDRTPDDFEARVGSQPVAKAPTSPDGYELKWHGEADEVPLKEWLVDKMLPKRGKAVLAGQWGTYKTFVALDLCCSVMTRSLFAGRPIHRQGGVLFIAAEGQDEVRVRLEGIAIEKVAKATPGDTRNEAKAVDPMRMPFAWAEACPRLTADDALAKLRAMVSAAARGMRERFGLPLALIVIDTLMPAAGFKDANDASENQRVMDVLTNVAMEAEALVLAVDHFGKDVTTGTRNSSVKEAAVDAVLALLAERDLAGNVSNPRLAIRKVRGAPTGQEFPFQTRTVTVQENAGYDAITTLVVDWREQTTTQAAVSPAKEKRRWPKSLIIFKKALDYALASSGKKILPFVDGPEVLAVEREMVRREFLKVYPADNVKAKAEAFRRCEKDAVSGSLMTAREVETAEGAATFFWSATSK